ncbi:Helix-turn-helix domain-containing protein [Haloechinothrix alba]|uniref:Helix-turn-helix domain-containing protein n=1 Tax=Haloechinothrix alba TaxID=664784 RepID=A0A238ZX72_9PSEU|nr:helix-turn-helix transcriptional regulator [Haloechinothrix alba]SNR87997.1 Helix-turn-helix domain-containing protein [Haloechinothrix alba]
MTSPVVAKIQLGRLLYDLRLECGQSREDAAEALDCDVSKVSRVEHGKGSLKTPEVDALLRLYDRADARDRAVELARTARRRSRYRVQKWAQDFVGMEAAAATIRAWHSELVPGPLQTPAYTRALISGANPNRTPEFVEQAVASRGERQERLLGDDGPTMFVVLNEAVIRRMVGGAKVMEDQLTFLLKLSERPRVSLHVLPFTAGAHAAMDSPFEMLDVPEAEVRLVYLEDLDDSRYLDQSEEIERYSMVFERLLGAALGPVETVTLLEEVRQTMA